MLKSYKLCLLTFIMFISCSSGDDWESYRQDQWKQELSSIVEMCSGVLENSGITLVDITSVGSPCVIDSKDILCNTSLMPIFRINFDRFDLISYEDFATDTSAIHYRPSYLQAYVDNLINTRTKHTQVVLTWKQDGNLFSSLALFDYNTSEFEYDNILFNIFISDTTKFRKLPTVLTRSENSGGGNVQHKPSSELFEANGYEGVNFLNVSLQTIAYAGISWKVYGKWVTRDMYDINNNVVGHEKVYRHDCIEREISKWTDPNISNLTAEVIFEDRSTQDSVSMKYLVWAGLSSSSPSFVLDYYSIGPNTTLPLDRPSWFYDVSVINRGFVKTRSFKPYSLLPL